MNVAVLLWIGRVFKAKSSQDTDKEFPKEFPISPHNLFRWWCWWFISLKLISLSLTPPPPHITTKYSSQAKKRKLFLVAIETSYTPPLSLSLFPFEMPKTRILWLWRCLFIMYSIAQHLGPLLMRVLGPNS